MEANEKAAVGTTAIEISESENKSNVIPLYEEITAEVKSSNANTGIFVIKTGSQWLADASKKAIPKPLYNPFWYEGEVCVLFSDTNLGKSILAVQIGNEISKNEKVVYLDFELSDKQFEARYSEDYTNHYPFNDNFLRAEIDPDKVDYEGCGFRNIEDYINHSIETILNQTGAKVLIVDNLTYLRSETEKAKEALPLMKHLKQLKNKYELSILVLAHTPKRDLSMPITRNDLQGSKMLMNFCDSAFTIGESAKDKSLRYLKQIKVRVSSFTYDTDNVLVCEVGKKTNFLAFSPVQGVHSCYEHEHLKRHTKEDRDSKIAMSRDLHSKGLTQREIAERIGMSIGTVNSYLND